MLDAARARRGGDPDLLYYVAHLYTRIGQKETDRAGARAGRARSTRPTRPASNDLGYGWADAGKNLDRAEALIRVAVEAEPDNQSFLDSLGWVLYKRGQFDEARRHLEQAIGRRARRRTRSCSITSATCCTAWASRRRRRAVAAHRRAASPERPPTEREELNKLRLQLEQKLKQAERRQPVNVAPVVEDSRRAQKLGERLA